MKKTILALFAAVILVAGASAAEAKGHHGHRGHHGGMHHHNGGGHRDHFHLPGIRGAYNHSRRDFIHGHKIYCNNVTGYCFHG